MDQQKAKAEPRIESEDLAEALKGNRFKEFLDKIPIAIVLGAMQPTECIVYANSHYETLTGEPGAVLEGKSWDALKGRAQNDDRELSQAITEASDHIGTFIIEPPGGEPVLAEAYSNVIETDEGIPDYRLVALIPVSTGARSVGAIAPRQGLAAAGAAASGQEQPADDYGADPSRIPELARGQGRAVPSSGPHRGAEDPLSEPII
ncbi:MAG: hypothetical protein WBX25_26200 [Rhodomicrobium sp.]